MPVYEVMVVCDVSAIYEIEADSPEEAKAEAETIWSASDLETDTADLRDVLIETFPGSRSFA